MEEGHVDPLPVHGPEGGGGIEVAGRAIGKSLIEFTVLHVGAGHPARVLPAVGGVQVEWNSSLELYVLDANDVPGPGTATLGPYDLG